MHRAEWRFLLGPSSWRSLVFSASGVRHSFKQLDNAAQMSLVPFTDADSRQFFVVINGKEASNRFCMPKKPFRKKSPGLNAKSNHFPALRRLSSLQSI